MKTMLRLGVLVTTLGLSIGVVQASKDTDTASLFRNSGQSSSFFNKSYAYAIFPTIGKAALGVGGAYGTGHVYENGRRIGRATVTQLSFGMQAGGEAFSQIIFFEDKRALDNFTSGNFEFSADVGAVAITAAASVTAGTTGAEAAASGGKNDAVAASEYHNGLAVFTIAKGGLMYQAAVAGEKFKYEPVAAK
jgi:lipid-binding SYLF domain-containing protein